MLSCTILGFLSLATLAIADLDHPAVSPPINRTIVGQGLTSRSLPIESYDYTQLPDGMIPQDCKSLAKGNGFDPTKVVGYNVTYDDCKTPWYLCIHNAVQTPPETMFNTFGRIPVTARAATKHLMLLPGGSCSGVTYLPDGNTILFGQCGTGISAYIHENTHSNDFHGFKAAAHHPFSESPAWVSAYNSDTAVVTDYARTAQGENLAETSWAAMYDVNVDGGLKNAEPNRQALANQLATIVQYGGDQFHPGGKCPYRLASSPIVSSGGGSSRLARRVSAVNINIDESIEVRDVPAFFKDTIKRATTYY